MSSKFFKKTFPYFFPHPETHRKAELLSWHFLVIYVLLFILLKVGFDLVSIYKPGVLGISSSITNSEIITDTNKERQQDNLSLLKENSDLDKAALAKAQDMFSENYWSHYSPSGKDPWGFIVGAGYNFSYAGENLARNFSSSQDVVTAWMNSPSHRENLLNQNYQDIGVAVVSGVLQGQKTTLVVQEFGKPAQEMAVVPQQIPALPQNISNSSASNSNQSVLSANELNNSQIWGFVIDPFAVTKTAATMLIILISSLLIVDFIVLKKRGVWRLSSHHLAHLSLLAVTEVAILAAHAGEIL